MDVSGVQALLKDSEGTKTAAQQCMENEQKKAEMDRHKQERISKEITAIVNKLKIFLQTPAREQATVLSIYCVERESRFAGFKRSMDVGKDELVRRAWSCSMCLASDLVTSDSYAIDYLDEVLKPALQLLEKACKGTNWTPKLKTKRTIGWIHDVRWYLLEVVFSQA